MSKKQRRLEIFLIIIFIFVSLFSISSAKDDKTRFFDVSEEKIYNYSVNWDRYDFYEDRIIIQFKKTDRYPILTKSDFNFSNIDKIEYAFAQPQKDREDWYYDFFRQVAYVYLKEKGRSKVLEAVDYFNKIEIIKSATPKQIYQAFPDDLI